MDSNSLSRRLLGAACIGLVAGMLLTGCSAKITQDPGQVLVDKVKSNKNAYLRYAQAEEEARRDGRNEAAERYRDAKEKALAQYKQFDQELNQYAAAHPNAVEQDATP